MQDWRMLCGLAVAICGQATFQKEARILKRLVSRYGPEETESLLLGAKLLGWSDLKGLNAKEGIGRRMARQAYFDSLKRSPLTEEWQGIL